jgi:leader peptidase (prepilin peptidase)/N-methyltransferase
MVVIIFVGVLGLILGSFVNALVWRTHEQSHIRNQNLKDKVQSDKKLRELSIWHGRSICPNCKHKLAAKDLVPLFSWLALGGKCRYCRKPISWLYPVIELSTATFFIVSYCCWPYGFQGEGLVQFCFWLVFLVGFVALTIYDVRWFLLPDRIVFPLVWLALAELAIRVVFFDGGWPLLFGALWGVLIASGIFYVLYQISGGAWIGGGDVKLGLVLGLLVGGPFNAMLLLFIASLLGTFTSIPLIAAGKANRKTLLPFGPYLLIAAFAVVVYGPYITTWFKNFLAY